ncbi:MAG: type IV pilus assembly protein PilM [Candidatus Omnitrophota bacterium]
MAKNKNTINEVTGLDIGSHSVKIVSITKNADAEVLSAYNIKRIPTNDGIPGIKETIKSALDEIDILPKEVNLSLSGQDIIVRFINLPKMKKDQLDAALAYEAEKYIPFNVNEVVLDSIILGDVLNSGQMKVLLAAGKKDFIEGRVKMIEGLGMETRIMDIAPFAMFNAFIKSHGLPEDKVCAFLNVGHSQTDVLILDGEVPCFTRQIQLGGKNVTNTLMKEFSLSEEEAEKKKMYPEDCDKEMVLNASLHMVKALVKELHLSFGYFENRYNKRVEKIYCTGGSVAQTGMAALLEEHVGIEIKKWDPIGEIKLGETISEEDIMQVSSQLAVAIGLALRG